jgi:uncharacterized protein (TIGR03083 family)
MASPVAAPDPRLTAKLYQETRERIVGLIRDGAWDTAVPACPAWTVRDVVAHLTAIAEDVVAGRLTGPPDDDETAAGIARFADHDESALIEAWAEHTAAMDRLGLEAPVADAVCHEHDIRGALGRPGSRDSPALRFSADRLLTILRTDIPLHVAVEDGDYRCGPADGSELALQTTRFEVLRWRTGRRSRAQLAAMDWSADPAAVLDQLFLFGPAAVDVIE